MKLLIILLIFIIWVVFIEPYILTVKTVKIQDSQLAGLKIVFATDHLTKNTKNLDSYVM